MSCTSFVPSKDLHNEQVNSGFTEIGRKRVDLTHHNFPFFFFYVLLLVCTGKNKRKEVENSSKRK